MSLFSVQFEENYFLLLYLITIWNALVHISDIAILHSFKKSTELLNYTLLRTIMISLILRKKYFLFADYFRIIKQEYKILIFLIFFSLSTYIHTIYVRQTFLSQILCCLVCQRHGLATTQNIQTCTASEDIILVLNWYGATLYIKDILFFEN